MFNRSYLQNEFEKLNGLLTENVTLYLIGGGAMSFRGLKDATKDVDVIVRTRKELKALETALKSAGYTVPCIRGPYKDMQASLILENDNGFRWDIFQNVVCNGFQLSEGMIKRTGPLISLEMLTVRLISPEDIFVFKSVTSREGDLADMYTLFMQVMDFEAIRDEVIWQNAHDRNFAWLAFFYDGLEEFADKYSLSHPILEELHDLAYNDMLCQMILERLKECAATETELIRMFKTDVKKQIEELEHKGFVKKEANGKISLNSYV